MGPQVHLRHARTHDVVGHHAAGAADDVGLARLQAEDRRTPMRRSMQATIATLAPAACAEPFGSDGGPASASSVEVYRARRCRVRCWQCHLRCSCEDHRAVPVHEHPVFDVPAHRLCQHRCSSTSGLAWRVANGVLVPGAVTSCSMIGPSSRSAVT